MSSIKNDSVLIGLSELVKPHVKKLHLSWGKFKPVIIKSLSTQTPAAFITRFGANQIEDTAGNAQKRLMNYAITVVIRDDQKADDAMFKLEDDILSSLQDFSVNGQKITGLKSQDVTTAETAKSKLLMLGIALQISTVNKTEKPKNEWVNGGLE